MNKIQLPKIPKSYLKKSLEGIKGLKKGVGVGGVEEEGKRIIELSRLSLGCASFGNAYGSINEKECYELLKKSFDNGINYLDTSPYYGKEQSEKRLGYLLQKLRLDYPKQRSYFRRNYYLSTKLGRYDMSHFDFSINKIRESLERSLDNLQTDYIDILFIHDLEFSQNLEQIYNETLPYLYELKQKTLSNDNNNNNNSDSNHFLKIRNIGLSGMPLNVLDFIANKFGYDKIDFILTYNTHILFNNELNSYIPRFQKHNIGIIHGGVTGLGLLTPQGPPSWHPANHLPIFKSLCQQAQKSLHSKNDYELVRLAYLYCYQNPAIHSILTGPTSLSELDRYLEWTQQNQLATQEEIQKDQQTIQHLQQNIFAPIMNRMWVNPGTEKNISDSYLHFYN